MPDFLLELFSEEMPARFQKGGEAHLKELLEGVCTQERLTYRQMDTASTPRRLVAMVWGLSSQGEDQTLEKRGPRLGSPEQAVQKFAASLGLEDSQLIQEGGYWFARYRVSGHATDQILAAELPGLIRRFAWPKSMVWASKSLSWVRPLRSILALLDNQVIPCEIEGLQSGATTRGHRNWGSEPLRVQGTDHYRHILATHGVVLTRAERAQRIREQIQALCLHHHLVWVEDEVLFEEVVGLVENPVVYQGKIPGSFISLPEQLLITVMSHHQRYFAVRYPDGRLAPFFLCVANREAPDQGRVMMRGYERVLKARLSDAHFFYNQDLRHTLFDHAQGLTKLLVTKDLGTLAQKGQRLESLARFLAPFWDLEAHDPLIATTASLLKADLTTSVVVEFPELQGVMGAHYAQCAGLPSSLVTAIQEHRHPQGEASPGPLSPLGTIMALADRLDTLVGFCGVGDMPTGSKDPLALRRAALGVVRIAWEHRDCAWLLDEAIACAYAGYQAQNMALKKSCESIQDALHAFMMDRMKGLLKQEDHEVVSAVLEAKASRSLGSIPGWVAALSAFLEIPEGMLFMSAYRRVDHILRIEEDKDQVMFTLSPDRALMDACELKLYQTTQHLPQADTPQALCAYWGNVAPLVQDFLETHRINDDRPPYRLNRLYLLNQVRQTVAPHIAYSKLSRRDSS